tara:strand:+ start:304 stop:684 length:381 start_codon:yes stop_codon:yes gene_type:complete
MDAELPKELQEAPSGQSVASVLGPAHFLDRTEQFHQFSCCHGRLPDWPNGADVPQQFNAQALWCVLSACEAHGSAAGTNRPYLSSMVPDGQQRLPDVRWSVLQRIVWFIPVEVEAVLIGPLSQTVA